MIAWLTSRLWFPNPAQARRDGLVAVGGDLSVERLVLAYRSGLFPWSVEPITWWSPDPRAIFEVGPEGVHVSRSLARTLRQPRWRVTVNAAFRQVIQGCADAHRHQGEWISPRFIEAYTALHEAGHAHSLECWCGDELAGGIYGVSVGGLFAGESMFHRVSDASKVAVWHLVQRLHQRGYTLFDTQMITDTTRSLGAIEIGRAEYLERLALAVSRECTFV